ncbi:hypothetical protein UFOVP1672_47 [uncultured Caudovirales phage]|uniref:Uncharacterized protein n=1 Tax=uncultured Caudovirales phage TaxID=2100421 RepID=A0A6J5SC46_9CAUD|nr:hypothetical protein UFOVP988_69 [uncultured Caudovirales phage]CAB4211058.1 hypothetical protein UFOVP1425_69 [uncultured Caudovirales phage]CAB4223430.1 hypothetical protein UFOVP1672_47 [uncultured Caudovirales phage]
MRLKVIAVYHGPSPRRRGLSTDFICVDEDGKSHRVDLFVDGGLDAEMPDADLIGRWVECSYLHPFIEIAADVRLAEKE